MRIEYDPKETQVFAVDPLKNVVTLGVADWQEHETAVFESDALADADAIVTDLTHASVSGLEGPPVYTLVIDTETGERETITGRRSVEFDANTVIQLCTTIRVVVRATAGGTVERHADRTTITFDRPTDVTIGWASRVDLPEQSVQIPESVEGVAEYLTVAGAAITETGPDRTWPNVRDHPPTLQFGAEEIPAELYDQRPETGIRLFVPEENGLQTLLPLAPLAYYLGAEVVVSSGMDPTLDLDGERRWLGQSAEEADPDASRILQRVFYLDCLARAAGPYGDELPQQPILEALGLDAEELYEAPIAERARQYLDVPYHEVANAFPEWHLGVHVNPVYEQVPALASHLNRLADIYAPESAELSIADRVEWAAEESFLRGDEPTTTKEPVVDPADRARTVGWAAPQTALGAFNYYPEAFDNRESFVGSDEPLSIAVVNNSMGMFDEHQRVIQNYEDRTNDVPIMEVEPRALTTPEELAAVFEHGYDVVHYIGHCDNDGLLCADKRYLHAASVSESNAAVFFLNACDSYDQGRELLRRGSVAGVVTRTPAVNSRAVQLGNDWSRMIANGWSVERGLDVARRTTDAPGDYLSIGDGAYSMSPDRGHAPAEVHLEETDQGGYQVRSDLRGPFGKGVQIASWPDREQACLMGEVREFTIGRSRLAREFDSRDYLAPVTLNGELIWNSNRF